VQHVRIEVDSVRPADGARDGVDSGVPKHREITQSLEDANADDPGEIEVSNKAVREHEPQDVSFSVFDLDDSGGTGHDRQATEADEPR
jgi:hypothetical protein